jgi:exodeoxyribonuclease-3
VKIATWNVNGIRARAGQVADWLAAERPDIACLQEIKASPDQVPALLLDLDGYWTCWHGAGGYSGVSLHVSKRVAPEPPLFRFPPFDVESRAVTVEVGGVTYASLYVPNGGRGLEPKLAFLDELRDFAARFAERAAPLVLCGDFNVTREARDVHPKERKPRAVGQLPVEREKFGAILAAGLVDVGRALDPDNDDLFTWWAPWRSLRERNIGWRLDYVLASESLARRATASRVGREIGTSDHGPVVVELRA